MTDRLDAIKAQVRNSDGIRPIKGWQQATITFGDALWLLDEVDRLRAELEPHRARAAAWSADCVRCETEALARLEDPVERLSSVKMHVCPDCGDKRCPRAADHRHRCGRMNDDRKGDA